MDLVTYDATLPADYACFQDEPAAHFAWAWRLRRPRAGERALHLDWQADDATTLAAVTDDSVAGLPCGLQALWFALSDAPALHQRADGQRCRWSRDA